MAKQFRIINKGKGELDVTPLDIEKVGEGLNEAPIDGQLYGRINVAWQVIPLAEYLPLAGGTMTGNIIMPQGISVSQSELVGFEMISTTVDGRAQLGGEQLPAVLRNGDNNFLADPIVRRGAEGATTDYFIYHQGFKPPAVLADFPNLASLISLQVLQQHGGIYWVQDGSGFTGINSGYVYVEFTVVPPAVPSGTEADYRIVSAEQGFTPGGAGDVEEAPIDGNPYSRQDAAWILAATGSGEVNVLADIGTAPAQTLAGGKSGPNLLLRGLLGTGAAVTSLNGNDVEVHVPIVVPGESNSLLSAGIGHSIVLPKSGVNLIVKSFIGTGALTITPSANGLTFNVPAGDADIYDGVRPTEAEILSLDPVIRAGQTWWAIDTKSAYQAIELLTVTPTVFVWQKITPQYNPATDSYDMPESQDGQKQNLGRELFSLGVNNSPAAVTSLVPKLFLLTDPDLVYPDFNNSILISGSGLYPGAKYGLNTTDAAIGGTMKVLRLGDLNGVDTSGWAQGVTLYADPLIEGELTTIKPTQNAYLVATVEVSDPVNGILVVNTTTAVDIVSSTEVFAGIPYYFSGDISPVNGVALSILPNTKGTVSTNITAVVDDNQTLEGNHRFILDPGLTADSVANKGVYQGQVQVSCSTAQANERVYVEIYKADLAGVPINVAPDGELGSLGINAVAIHRSAVLNLPANTIISIGLSAEILADIPIAAGETFLYVPLFEKLGTAGGAKTFTMLTGPSGDSYIQGLGTNPDSLVPYVGATKDVNLANHNFAANAGTFLGLVTSGATLVTIVNAASTALTTKEYVQEFAIGVSSDPDNYLTPGADGKPYAVIPIAGVSTDGPNMSEVGTDDKIYTPDAPLDANQWARTNGAWAQVIGFPEAPNDGKQYGRQSLGWTEVAGVIVTNYTSSAASDLLLTVSAAWNAQADIELITKAPGEVIFYNWPSTSSDVYQYNGSQTAAPWTSNDSQWNVQGGSIISWGDIIGDLNIQGDLASALDAKGAVGLDYTFLPDITATDPLNGGLKLNNVDQSAATEMYVSGFTGGGVDISDYWRGFQVTDFLNFIAKSGLRGFSSLEIVGPIVNNGSWFTVPIANVDFQGVVETNGPCQIYWSQNPKSTIRVGGTAGQVLAKIDGGDFNTQWVDPDTGPQGPSGTTYVASTVTLAAGQDAFVTETGTPENLGLNFGIPQGIQGVQGIQGEVGPQGTPGLGINVLGLEDVAVIITLTAAAVGDSWVSTTAGVDSQANPVAIDDALRAIDTLVPSTFVNIGPIQGDKGDTGATGATGVTPVISIGTVDPVLSGTPPSVSITGTPEAPVFNWQLEAGVQGVQGIQGVIGVDGPIGPAGEDGIDGQTVLNGIVDPIAEGVDGDFYINTATSFIFGPKAAGVWPPGISLVGATGADGTDGTNGTNGIDGLTVLNGVVDPTTEGVDGDFYINTVTNFIWGPKAAGSWAGTSVSLVGPQGPTGLTGGDGADGSDGLAATLDAGAVTTLLPGQPATVTAVGTLAAQIFDFGIPQGATGATGGDGPQGIPGVAATVDVFLPVIKIAPGGNPTVTNEGTSAAAEFQFGVVTGDTGDTGPQGDAGLGLNILGIEVSAVVITLTAAAIGDAYVSSTAGVDSNGDSLAIGDVLRAIDILVPSTWVTIGPLVGPQGLPGEDGEDGADGTNGADGASATLNVGTTTTLAPGVAATVTEAGTSLVQVFDFGIPEGIQGIPGAEGIQGPIGLTGPDGPQGPIGNTGAAGADGAVWILGIIPPTTEGVDGDLYLNTDTDDYYLKEVGVWNLQGNLKGSQGIQGIEGPQGDPGIQGEPGLDGLDGTDGTNGIAATATAGITIKLPAGGTPLVTNVGTTAAAIFDFSIVTGDTGATGGQGIQGDPGPTGAAGNDGAAATITAGATTTLAPGAPATVTPVGTPAAQIFDFGIPEGVQGVQGTAGTDGTDGIDGAPGLGTNPLGQDTVANIVAKTAVTLGDAYISTTAGSDSELSPVAIGDLLRATNTLTPSNWVTLGQIQGPQGIQGEQGVQGEKGDTGTTGTNGIDGNTWYSGLGVPDVGLGVDGDLYINTDILSNDYYLKVGGVWVLQGNIKGETGSQGTQGLQGDDGAQGIQGVDGPQGPIGPDGADSTVPGPDGPQGPIGNTGPAGGTGATGVTPVITTGVVIPVPSGTAPSVTISGTPEAPVFDWELEAGVQGVAGATGGVGPAGADGADSTVPGPQGDTGATGADSTVPGPDGPAGPTGPTGADSTVPGPQGDPGATGTDGEDGATGAAGPTGPAGPSAVSADAGNTAVLGGDNLIFVPVPPAAGVPYIGATQDLNLGLFDSIAFDHINTSDERLKSDIKDYVPIEVPVKWREYTIKGEKQIGVIAQELEKTNPEFVVSPENDGMKGVKYTRLLIAKVAELEDKNTTLESRLEALENIINNLKL